MRSIDLTHLGPLRHADTFSTLRLLSHNVDPIHWCLAGGLMVMLNAVEAGNTAPIRSNQTKDADIVVEIATGNRLRRVADALRSVGMEPIEPFLGQDFARCTFHAHGTTIDVLAPETSENDVLDLGDGLRSLAIPGGTHALATAAMTEVVFIDLDGEERDVDLRVPRWSDAVIVKAHAALDPRTAGQIRHLDDLIDLLTAPSPTIEPPGGAPSEILAALEHLLETSTRHGDADRYRALDRIVELSHTAT